MNEKTRGAIAVAALLLVLAAGIVIAYRMMAPRITVSMTVEQPGKRAPARRSGPRVPGTLLTVPEGPTVRNGPNFRHDASSPPSSQPSSHPSPLDVLLLPNDTFNAATDSSVSRNGNPPALMLSSTLTPMQDLPAWRMVDIARFRGKRVRFSAHVKAAGTLTNWASLILHVYGESPRRTYAFDDMIGRGITTATADWTPLEIVCDVPPQATGLAVGAHVKGSGQLWMDDARLEVVGKDVAPTDDHTNHLYTDLVSHYQLSLDPAVTRDGHPTACITSSAKPTGSWMWYGTYDHSPEPYLGHRIRVSAWIKSENVTRSARLAVWAITPQGKVIPIDNPAERQEITGTTDWTEYEITAQVPAALDHLDPGVNLFGNGKVWVDALRYELLPDR